MRTLQHLLLLHKQFGGTKIRSSVGFFWRSVQLRVKEEPQKRVGKDWKSLRGSAKVLTEFRVALIDTADCKVKDKFKDMTKGHRLVVKGRADKLCGRRTISLERDEWQKRRGSRRTRIKMGHSQVILWFLQNKIAQPFEVFILKNDMNNNHNNLKWKKFSLSSC